MSMSLALGPIARLRIRALYAVINSYFSWNVWVALTEDAREELRFWQSNVAALNGQPIWFKSGATRVVFSDASDYGYGGYSVEVGPEFVQGSWSEHEAQLTSTWRELKAVYQVLCSLAPKLRGHIMKWFTDNQNMTRIVQSGSKKPHLQDGAMAIYEICFQNGIKLEMKWIPRSQNELADYLSRIQDFDDWMIDPDFFDFVNLYWGPHTLDCFATSHNSQVARFHSRFWCPGAEVVDTFTVNWANEVCWLVPPLYLVGRALNVAI